jgi:hypothetical protein
MNKRRSIFFYLDSLLKLQVPPITITRLFIESGARPAGITLSLSRLDVLNIACRQALSDALWIAGEAAWLRTLLHTGSCGYRGRAANVTAWTVGVLLRLGADLHRLAAAADSS